MTKFSGLSAPIAINCFKRSPPESTGFFDKESV